MLTKPQESSPRRAHSFTILIRLFRGHNTSDSNGLHSLVVVVPQNETRVREAVRG